MSKDNWGEWLPCFAPNDDFESRHPLVGWPADLSGTTVQYRHKETGLAFSDFIYGNTNYREGQVQEAMQAIRTRIMVDLLKKRGEECASR